MMDIGKDLQDAYECGRQDALNELMEYTYGMLTSEKFGLQHKIKSMMADRKTENSSEIPNNCEDLQDWKDRMWAEAIVTEPTISKMEQVDKDINVRSKDEPQTKVKEKCDRPQMDIGTGCSRCGVRFGCIDRDMPHAVHCNSYGKITDEP